MRTSSVLAMAASWAMVAAGAACASSIPTRSDSRVDVGTDAGSDSSASDSATGSTDSATSSTDSAAPSTDSGVPELVGSWMLVDQRCQGVSIGLEAGIVSTTLDIRSADLDQIRTDGDCTETYSGPYTVTPPNGFDVTIDNLTCVPEGCLIGALDTPCNSAPVLPALLVMGTYIVSAAQLTIDVPGDGGACPVGETYTGVYDRVAP